MSALPYLTEEEIFDITHYWLPSKQMEVLRQLGVRATLLRDNTVRVMRMDCTNRNAAPIDDPKLNFA